MKYRVHIYATVRVPVEVEAESQIDAIKKSVEEVNLDSLLSHLPRFEYAEEITGYLVDEDGDTDYQESRSYKADGVTLDIATNWFDVVKEDI